MIVQWAKFCRLNDRYDYLSNKFIEAIDASNWSYAQKLCPKIDEVCKEIMGLCV